ncbi:MAG TPA: HupE/UreJ family protein [Polyangiaceae bacterium]|nr:HupE/UreJ family protein [Polyangiaceae bacterium]
MRRGTVAALLAFNVGIELAQLLLVVGCLTLPVWARGLPSKLPWLGS